MRGELAKQFSFLTKTNCWAVLGGAGTGSILNLHFGKKIPRSRPIKNPRLPPESQAYEGEFVVFITCAWRLMSDKEIVCGSFSNNEKGGVMLTGLNQIIGQNVRRVELIPDTLDLRIFFENDLQLHLFNNLGEADNSDVSYSIKSTEQKYLFIGTHFEVVERR